MKLSKKNSYTGKTVNINKIIKGISAITIASIMSLTGCSSEKTNYEEHGFSYVINAETGQYSLTSVVGSDYLSTSKMYVFKDVDDENKIMFLDYDAYFAAYNYHILTLETLNIETGEVIVEEYNAEELTEKNIYDQIIDCSSSEGIKMIYAEGFSYELIYTEDILPKLAAKYYPKSFYTCEEITTVMEEMRQEYLNKNKTEETPTKTLIQEYLLLFF